MDDYERVLRDVYLVVDETLQQRILQVLEKVCLEAPQNYKTAAYFAR